MKHALVLVTLLSFSACATQRLRYTAQFETEGAAKRFEFQKSYEVGGGIPTLCGLTAIFFGGACWYYLVMPTVPDQAQAAKDGEAALKKLLGEKPYAVKGTAVDLMGWDEAAETSKEE